MKLQSATEYLASYGWTVLIIALVLIGLFYIGVFSNKQVTSNCIFPGGSLACTNIYIAGNGLLTADVQQGGTYPINVTAIGCNTNSAQAVTTNDINPPGNTVYMIAHQIYQFTAQCYNDSTAYSGNPGDVYTGYFILQYLDTYTGLPTTAYAQIQVKVT